MPASLSRAVFQRIESHTTAWMDTHEFVPMPGELFVLVDAGQLLNYKVGDGVHTLRDLPYVGLGGALSVAEDHLQSCEIDDGELFLILGEDR